MWGVSLKKKLSHIIFAIIFFLVATLTITIMILHMFNGMIVLPVYIQVPYTYLSLIFLQSAWFVPAYLYFCAFLFLYIDDDHPYQVLFPITLILFATIVLFLQCTFGSEDLALNNYIASHMDGHTASLIVLFIFVLESLFFFIWSFKWFGKDQDTSSKNYVLYREKLTGHEDSTSTTDDLKVKTVIQRAQATDHPVLGSDDDHHFQEMRLSFPVIPDLPILKKIRQSGCDETVSSDDIKIPQQDEDRKEVSDHNSSISGMCKKPEHTINGKLREILPENTIQNDKDKTIIVGNQSIPVLPMEDPNFTNVPKQQEPTISGRLKRVSDAVNTVCDLTDVDAVDFAHTEVDASFTKRLGYIKPSEDVLDSYPDVSSEIDHLTEVSGQILMKTLREFKIDAELTGIQKGPVVTMYEILPAPGIRVQAITNLADNIALQLAASRVRMVAPIPGKQAVGIEVPNKKRSIVSFREMLEEVDRKTNYELPIVLGKDVTGRSQVIDLVKTPHLLIAGATGSGKSVCVNSLICSILFRRSPKDVRLMLVDPKIVELKLYNDIPHLLTPVITDSKKTIKALQYCIYEMERRYDLLDQLNVRDITIYNRRIKEQHIAQEKLPYIVLVIDEFADLMTTTGKEMESYLARLAAMARAVGIHLVLATQRPSTNVITGIIKANIPSRIAFMVTSNTDSRIILDQPGAEKLLGRGDMLFSSSWNPNLVRLQGAFLSEEEVERIVDEVRKNGEPDYLDEELFWDDEDEDVTTAGNGEGDPLMEEALKIIYSRNSASASYLQRRLKIGYNRAARLIEEFEERGIVGPARGSQPREVLRKSDIDF